jgi:predicted acylesterase/phospholipase RssA
MPPFVRREALRETLSELVDLTIINLRSPRLMVGAAKVETSMMHYFDIREMPMTVEKVMALGALPPAFPAINIEGRFCRDGGILSNTPTEVIFDDIPLHNSRIFAVQLWNPKGRVPRNPGGSALAKRTFNIRAASPVMPLGSNRRTGCSTSSANLCSRFPPSNEPAKSVASLPAMAA